MQDNLHVAILVWHWGKVALYKEELSDVSRRGVCLQGLHRPLGCPHHLILVCLDCEEKFEKQHEVRES